MNNAVVVAITALTVVLTGCVDVESLIPKANMDAKPAVFPYPGIYTATVTGGTLTYRIDASGRGLSCIRGIHGRMAYGDVIYDGAILHTEDGDLEVYSVAHSHQQWLRRGGVFSRARRRWAEYGHHAFARIPEARRRRIRNDEKVTRRRGALGRATVGDWGKPVPHGHRFLRLFGARVACVARGVTVAHSAATQASDNQRPGSTTCTSVCPCSNHSARPFRCRFSLQGRSLRLMASLLLRTALHMGLHPSSYKARTPPALLQRHRDSDRHSVQALPAFRPPV
jgi:hypothetical protein